MKLLSKGCGLCVTAALALSGCSDGGNDGSAGTPETPTPNGAFELEQGSYLLTLESPSTGFLLGAFNSDITLSAEGQGVTRYYYTATDLGDGRFQFAACDNLGDTYTDGQFRNYILEDEALADDEVLNAFCGEVELASEAEDHIQVQQDCGVYGRRKLTFSKVTEVAVEDFSQVALQWNAGNGVFVSQGICGFATYQGHRLASAETTDAGEEAVKMAGLTLAIPEQSGGGSISIYLQPGFEDGTYSAADARELFGENPTFVVWLINNNNLYSQAGGTLSVSTLEDQVQLTLAVEIQGGSELTGEITFRLPQ